MYQVFIRQSMNGKETLIHSARNNDLKLANAQIILDTAAIPAFTFEIYPPNVGYDQLAYMVTLVRVHDTVNNFDPFEGRVLSPTDPIDQDGITYKTVTAEGLAAFLHDSRPDFVSYVGKTYADIFSSLINMHNSQMTAGGSPDKCFKLGNVSLSATAATCYTDDSATTYDNITNLILTYGYELSVRHESDGLYIDCAKSIGGTGNQVIELKRNLITFTRTIDPSALVTAFKPLGTAAETSSDTSADSGSARLTISSANGGSELIRDEALIKQFGLIIGTNTWDDITDAATLKSTGAAYFNALKVATISVQVTAVDLSFIGEASGPLLNGWTYRTVIPFKGIDEPLRIKQSTIDINDPSQNSYTMGDRVVGLEAYNAALASQVSSLKGYRQKLAAVQAQNAEAVAAAQAAQTEVAALTVKVNALAAASSGSDDGTNYDPTGLIIDVSEFQGSINWTSVCAAGLALAVIRIQSGSDHADETYTTNVPAAIAAGANYGVYAYFAALNASDAETEATDFYNRTKAVVGSKRAPKLYMIDVEANSVTSGTLSAAVTAYLNKLNSLGVPDSKIVIYVSNALHNSIDTSRTMIWMPSYGVNDGTVAGSTKPNYGYDLWQYTSQGHVAGITANTVDMSTDPSARFKSAFLTK